MRGVTSRRALWFPLAVLALAAACAGRQRLEAIQRLSDDDKALFSRYRQFMTDGQQDTFLSAQSSEERQAFVASLKVEERLAHYPKFVQEAIWSQEVVPGMDKEAVLLTWSTPVLREWDDAQLSKGNEVERWSFRRNDQYVQVVITNGVVTSVERAEDSQ